MTPNPMKSSRQFRDNVRIFAQDAARILHQLLLSDFMMQLSRGLNVRDNGIYAIFEDINSSRLSWSSVFCECEN